MFQHPGVLLFCKAKVICKYDENEKKRYQKIFDKQLYGTLVDWSNWIKQINEKMETHITNNLSAHCSFLCLVSLWHARRLDSGEV